jgi:hypothetical protein
MPYTAQFTIFLRFQVLVTCSSATNEQTLGAESTSGTMSSKNRNSVAAKEAKKE